MVWALSPFAEHGKESGLRAGIGRAATSAARAPEVSEGIQLRLGDLLARIVVRAAGYCSDYSWIDILSVVRGGRPVHRRGVTEVPGLYLPGPSWQHTRGSAVLGFVPMTPPTSSATSPPWPGPPGLLPSRCLATA
jgi:hypothetical protein